MGLENLDIEKMKREQTHDVPEGFFNMVQENVMREVSKFRKNEEKLKTYVKLPIPIQAVQWNGNYSDLKGIFPIENAIEPTEITRNGKVVVTTLEGKMTGNLGDYIVIGVENEVYICKKEIFEKTYKEVK